jgi:hypothetical protein
MFNTIRPYFTAFARQKIIILGTEYPEYRLYKKLLKQNFAVPFFITNDPWKHRTMIEEAICYYPSELPALCESEHISKVMYCDEQWLQQMPIINVPLIFEH